VGGTCVTVAILPGSAATTDSAIEAVRNIVSKITSLAESISASGFAVRGGPVGKLQN